MYDLNESQVWNIKKYKNNCKLILQQQIILFFFPTISLYRLHSRLHLDILGELEKYTHLVHRSPKVSFNMIAQSGLHLSPQGLFLCDLAELCVLGLLLVFLHTDPYNLIVYLF